MEESLEWITPSRILYATRSGKESQKALENFAKQVIQEMEQSGRFPVHLIWQMSGLDVSEMDQRQAMIELNRIMKHTQLGWFIVVDRDMSGFRRFLVSSIMRLSGIHWHTVDSKEEGIDFLHKIDPSLAIPRK